MFVSQSMINPLVKAIYDHKDKGHCILFTWFFFSILNKSAFITITKRGNNSWLTSLLSCTLLYVFYTLLGKTVERIQLSGGMRGGSLDSLPPSPQHLRFLTRYIAQWLSYSIWCLCLLKRMSVLGICTSAKLIWKNIWRGVVCQRW